MDEMTKLWAEVEAKGWQPGDAGTLADGRSVAVGSEENRLVLRIAGSAGATIVRERDWSRPVMTGTREQCAAWIRGQDVGTPEAREAKAREMEASGPAGVMVWDAGILP